MTTSQVRSAHTARFACDWPTPSVAIVRVRGDIDAFNADNLTEYACAQITVARGLVLDLSSLDFIGTEGFSALHRISVSCARSGMGWALVPGAAARRVLRICDPHCSLPAADTVEAALAAVSATFLPRPLLTGTG